MELKQLDYFVHVVDLGSFTRAAAMLSVAQSALSHQVRQLEVELRQSLLHRNGRGVTPTDAGKRFLAHARGILAQVSRARDELAESRGEPVGHVVLGMPATVARHLTVPLFRLFRRRLSGATIGIVEGLSASIMEWLATGRVDVGMVYDASPAQAIDVMPLYDQQLYLVRPRSDVGAESTVPIPMRDLPRYPLIVPSRHNASRMRLESQLASLGLSPQIAFEIDSISSVLELAHEGYGYAILPLSSLRAHRLAHEFVVTPIIDPILTMQLSLIVSAQRPSTPLTRATLELVRGIALEQLVRGPSEHQRE